MNTMPVDITFADVCIVFVLIPRTSTKKYISNILNPSPIALTKNTSRYSFTLFPLYASESLNVKVLPRYQFVVVENIKASDVAAG